MFILQDPARDTPAGAASLPRRYTTPGKRRIELKPPRAYATILPVGAAGASALLTMIKVYTSDDRVLVHHLKNILEAEGIECRIKNDQIHTLAGEVPAVEIWPEIWVIDENVAARAIQIVNDARMDPPASGNRWTCAGCGEVHEPQFTECWNCGAARPE